MARSRKLIAIARYEHAGGIPPDLESATYSTLTSDAAISLSPDVVLNTPVTLTKLPSETSAGDITRIPRDLSASLM